MNTSQRLPLVGLFVTCLVDSIRPNIGFAAVKLLEDAGCKIEVPKGQTCCGQPAFNSGDEKHAIALAKLTIQSFEGYDYLVAPSGSCAGMIKVHYPTLLEHDDVWHERAVKLSKKSHELMSFLVDVMGYKKPNAQYKANVTYHDSCAGLRELGIKEQPRELLNNLDGISLTEMKDTDVCCGFGGTFCIKYPDISGKMVDDKLQNILHSKADTVLGGDLGCLMNIAGRASRCNQPIKVYHIAEILADMTDVPPLGQQGS